MKMTIGNKYKVKCGWGLTTATLTQMYQDKNHKTVYVFKENTGYGFISRDLDGIEEIK